MNKPLVSVCIPTFNGEKFIQKSIESVLSQSYTNIELLISDHGSTDRTLDLIFQALDQSQRDLSYSIKEYSRDRNPAENWENAVSGARGTYLKVLGQDDILSPHCIETEVAVLEESHNVSIVFGPRNIIGPRGKVLFSSSSRLPPKRYTLSEIAREVLKHGTNVIGEPCCVMFTKHAKEISGQFSGQYLIDLQMWMKILECGDAIVHGETLSSFRIGKTTWTSTLKNRQSEEFETFVKDSDKYFPFATALTLNVAVCRARFLSLLRRLVIRYALLSRK